MTWVLQRDCCPVPARCAHPMTRWFPSCRGASGARWWRRAGSRRGSKCWTKGYPSAGSRGRGRGGAGALEFGRGGEARSTTELEDLADAAIAACGALEDWATVARAYRLKGDALGRRGAQAAALMAYEEGQRLALRVGDEREANERANLGIVIGPLPVERCIEFTMRRLEGAEREFSTAIALLAEALYRQGKLDEAMLATLASEGSTAPDDLASQMAWRGVRAKVLAAPGDLREAESLGRSAVGFAD